ncbi:glycosyltransferase [Pelistega ratti]|uniref:glycosyltransferase n=1 Tax=Pelistega ratti TaxID=2652177 RepID=UPI00135B605C
MVAFDVRYGPSATIENGYNVFLIESNNSDTFIDKIVELLLNSEMNQLFSENAYASMQKV